MEMLVIAIVAIVAFAAVLLPLLRRSRGAAADAREFDAGAGAPRNGAAVSAAHAVTAAATTATSGHAGDDMIEREVLRYREALRAGTLCARCGQANPPGSAYCADC